MQKNFFNPNIFQKKTANSRVSTLSHSFLVTRTGFTWMQRGRVSLEGHFLLKALEHMYQTSGTHSMDSYLSENV